MAKQTLTRTTKKATHLWLTDNEQHCALLAEKPEAFVIGFILDQQVTVQKAFRAPADLLARIGTISPIDIAAYDTQQLIDAFSEKPALHRFPAAMAKRVQKAMQVIVDEYDADAGSIWWQASGLDDLKKRLTRIPGLGGGKTFSIVAVLARQCGVSVTGWEKDIPDWGTLGDVDSPEALKEYQSKKRAYKAKKRAAEAKL